MTVLERLKMMNKKEAYALICWLVRGYSDANAAGVINKWLDDPWTIAHEQGLGVVIKEIEKKEKP